MSALLSTLKITCCVTVSMLAGAWLHATFWQARTLVPNAFAVSALQAHKTERSCESTVHDLKQSHDLPDVESQVPPSVELSGDDSGNSHAGTVDTDASLNALEQSPSEYFMQFDRAVYGGVRDPQWHPDKAIIAQVAAVDADSQVTDVTCAADLCRVEVLHQSSTDKVQFIAKLDPLLPPPPNMGMPVLQLPSKVNVFSGGVQFNGANDNPTVTHMYVSRPGRNFGFGEPEYTTITPEFQRALAAIRAQRASQVVDSQDPR